MMRSRAVMLCLMLLSVVGGLAARPGTPESQDYTQMRDRAEAWVAEGSWSRALDVYRQIGSRLTLNEEQSRWVEFRLGDCGWRASGNEMEISQSTDRLFALIASTEDDDRDRVWAEARESIADYWWDPSRRRQGDAFGHYQAALGWWAGARDIELARTRYLAIIAKMATPDGWRGRWGGYHSVPLELVENAVEIAVERSDRARANLLLASVLQRYGSSPYRVERMRRAFEVAMESQKSDPWHDDALFLYAQWLSNTGPIHYREDGGWEHRPDFVRALELYAQLRAEYRQGESPYYREVGNRIKEIRAEVVNIGVSSAFLPGSLVEYSLQWRNLDSFDMTLHKIDLLSAMKRPATDSSVHGWTSHVDLAGQDLVREWTVETNDTGKHLYGGKSVVMEEPLPTGAYMLTARSKDATARQLVLVSDLSIAVKADDRRIVGYVCDALDGSPVAEASVRMLDFRFRESRWVGEDDRMSADDHGLAEHDAAPPRSNQYRAGLLVLASSGDRHAFAITNVPILQQSDEWRVYTATDRSAYRPEDTVKWKVTARARERGEYVTPSGRTLAYEINGPRGKVDEGTLELNAFGSAWTELALSPSMALGEYSVVFKDGGNWISQASLFRLEEYKLPEFEVAVSTPVDEKGRAQTFRLGDPVEIDIDATYYFGGPVAGANVEIVVHQRPYWYRWTPRREYPWYYENQQHYRGWGYGSVVLQKTIPTDETGRATFTLETPASAGEDYEYTIEARVTDASRREVTSSTTLRVTRQSYYVNMRPEHSLHRPGEMATIEVNATNANHEPVAVEGTVTITRETWREVWVDPLGREYTGLALDECRRGSRVFPPPTLPGQGYWWCKHSGYDREVIDTRDVTTDDAGKATFAFTPQKVGYYRFNWTSPDTGRVPITATTAIWVIDRDVQRLGYHQDGVELIIDDDTARSGETMPVMISVPTTDRWVLLTVEGQHLYHHELVHVTGTVKLVRLPIEPAYVPNVRIQATMVTDARIYRDQEDLIVPPVEQFIEVAVAPDDEAYEPGETGTYTITTTDIDGNPVTAEVSFSVFDASVLAIQGEYAGDPRQFFYGQRQGHNVSSGTSFDRLAYVRLLAKKADEDLRTNAPTSAPAGAIVAESAAGMGGGGRDAARRQSRGRADGLASRENAVALGGELEEMRQMAGEGMDFDDAMAPMSAPADGGPVRVRQDFRATIAWAPDVVTDDSGRATVEVTYADSLTRWKAGARAATTGSRFGWGDATTRTRQPLIARLQAPRFFVVGDTITLSGNINNNTDDDARVSVELEGEGLRVNGVLVDGRVMGSTITEIDVPANGETRVDWMASAEVAGETKLTLTARGGGYADAMVRSYPVVEHGIEQFVATSGKVRGQSVTAQVDLPAQRRHDSTTVAVTVSPSMAVTMLDALPYLADYPYGCTEQTMSRFLPAVVTAKTLEDLGLSREEALAGVFGGIEREHVDKTHPDQDRNDLRKLDDMVRKGLDRLYDFQHGDGGWGWWKKGDSDAYMTAYVVWGLSLAIDAGIDIDTDVLTRGARFLDQRLVEAENSIDLQAWMLHALANADTRLRGFEAEFDGRAAQNLWARKSRLSSYGRALFALAEHARGETEHAELLVRNLESGVTSDEAPDTSILVDRGSGAHPATIGTAHWGRARGWRRSWESGVETTAFALRALVTIDPDNALIEPVTNWMVKNRRGSQWSNTRDTAYAVLALNDYLRASGELAPAFSYDVIVNGTTVASHDVTPRDALAAPKRIEIDPGYLRNGTNDVQIVRRDGGGSIYFAVEATFFNMEVPIPAAGNEVFVRRDYYRLVPRETLLKGYVYDRIHLQDGDYVQSGERIEVVLTMEAKNDYEYLVFEDLKPAGFEAVDLTSGGDMIVRQLQEAAVIDRFDRPEAEITDRTRQPGVRPSRDYTGQRQWVHHELRDRKVAVFVDRMGQGHWEVRYDLRAEAPGQFHALPVLGHAMYVPEVRCNSNEIRVTVGDRN